MTSLLRSLTGGRSSFSSLDGKDHSTESVTLHKGMTSNSIKHGDDSGCGPHRYLVLDLLFIKGRVTKTAKSEYLETHILVAVAFLSSAGRILSKCTTPQS